jgi:hypothetical protein
MNTEKLSPSQTLRLRLASTAKWSLTFVVVLCVGSGCSKTPDSSPAITENLSRQQNQTQLQNIQNDPRLTPEAKKRTIAILQAQQAATSKQPTSP